MADSKNITATKARVATKLNQIIDRNMDNRQLTRTMEEKVNNARAVTGVVTKFYPYLDKAEVKIDDSKKKVLCTILHRFGGELIDFFTPNGDKTYCDKLKEPCIKPRGDLNCFIIKAKKEWLLLGYFQSEEIIGVNPASMGDMKLVTRGGANQYWIKFGYAGLDIRSSTTPVTNVGETDDDMDELNYANTKDVYTKEELDVIIQGYEERIARLEEIIGETEETTP